jgi:hypothetical protein
MMQVDLGTALDAWEGFYLIIGGAGAALTGLQFVVMSVLDGARNRGDSRVTADPTAVGAFGTPTVVHFCVALLIAGVLTAPWETVGGIAAMLVYKPVLEDWLFHALFPVISYGGLVLGGILLRRDIEDALFVVGAMAMFLLFIGIHNAWDTVTYLMLGSEPPAGSGTPPSSRPLRPPVQGRRGRRRR